MTTYSVAIICQNENNPVFKACLDSALNYFQADEIIIVDGGSADGTREAVWEWFPRNTKIKVFSRPFTKPRDYTTNKNYALDQCSSDYILTLDADEVLSDDSFLLKKEVEAQPEVLAWDVKGVHYVYSLEAVDATVQDHLFLRRLIKNDPSLRYPPNTMHGIIMLPEDMQAQPTERTYLHHFGYLKGLLSYMTRKWDTNSKTWEMHTPHQFQRYITQVLTGNYPIKQRTEELPSALKLNRFLI